MPRQSLAFLAAISTALLAVACGSSSTSSSTTSGTTTAGSGGSGGSGATTTTAGSGGAGGSSTTTTTTAGSGGSGGAAMGACTNAADLAIAMSKDLAAIVGKCGQDNLGAEPATMNCIKMNTGLSDPCVVCFDNTVSCVVQKCFSECISDSGSQACKDCRKMNCDPAFEACSGLPSSNM